MLSLTMQHLKCGVLLSTLAVLSALPTFAADQVANFGTLSLSKGFKSAVGVPSGQTGGSFSLPSLANRDRNNNLCLGFAEQKPDYIMDLKDDFDHLKIQVDSSGKDTTLMIQGPKRHDISLR